MGEAAQRSLQTADGDRHVTPYTANGTAVGDGGAIGSQTRLAAGGVGVLTAFALGGGVVGHHGVDVAAVDQKRQPRRTKAAIILVALGLGEDAHAIAVAFQHTGDDGGAEAGVVHVGVTRHQHKIRLLPSALFHVRRRNGQKRHRSSLLSEILTILPQILSFFK